METNPRKQRQHFYRDYASGQWSMSELCDRYQISRPTGYKWADRIEAEGLKAVEERSRASSSYRPRGEGEMGLSLRSLPFEADARFASGRPSRFPHPRSAV
ncbi:MAG: helix-turn-helix domain-containing protein [Deltaproteobacteria bacterium]|nr:helix-turn-helix domain-containing protein [Deltaproteobacteria bacterium]MBW2693843.1 helix-turn-helix domain-containing protein [Deltaproteobacteria bacterium]